MIANGDKIYVIQINMADPGQNPEWDNCGAYEDYEQAVTQIDWMKGEYGDEIEYRIDTVQFYAKPNVDSWIANPDRSGGQFTQDEINNAGRWV